MPRSKNPNKRKYRRRCPNKNKAVEQIKADFQRLYMEYTALMYDPYASTATKMVFLERMIHFRTRMDKFLAPASLALPTEKRPYTRRQAPLSTDVPTQNTT